MRNLLDHVNGFLHRLYVAGEFGQGQNGACIWKDENAPGQTHRMAGFQSCWRSTCSVAHCRLKPNLVAQTEWNNKLSDLNNLTPEESHQVMPREPVKTTS